MKQEKVLQVVKEAVETDDLALVARDLGLLFKLAKSSAAYKRLKKYRQQDIGNSCDLARQLMTTVAKAV